MSKQCTKCLAVLPFSEFNSGNGRNGLSSHCKTCIREYKRRTRPPRRGGNDDPRPCGHCGIVYAPKSRQPSFWCSRECKTAARHAAEMATRQAAKEALPPRHCTHCGGAMPTSMRIDAGFCSDACNSAAHAITRKMAKRAGRAKSYDDPLLERAAIARRDKYRCGICGGKVNMKLRHPDPMFGSIDHLVPLARGGTNELANLQLAHLRCNLSKRADARDEQLRLIG